jgi:hypothetical protein
MASISIPASTSASTAAISQPAMTALPSRADGGAKAYALMQTCADIQITNCTFADPIFACIGIGSETSGGIRNVRIEGYKITHAQTFAIYIKSRVGRGAFIRGHYCHQPRRFGNGGRVPALQRSLQLHSG